MPASWDIKCSKQAELIVNPIRIISDNTGPSPSTKSVIKLCIGDPTIDQNLLPPENLIRATQEAAASHTHDGYNPTVGSADARDAVATYWKRFVSDSQLHSTIQADNVVLTSGGSHAIVLALTAVCNPGDNVLIPTPGYTHYATTCNACGIECRYYHLNPDNDWQIDLDEVASLCDDKTKMFIMTNPSNPCGNNFSAKHVCDVVKMCERLHLPMLADEIYAFLVFKYQGNPNPNFYSVANVESDVPRVILGGTAKTHLVPGWRIGWLIHVDPARVAERLLYGIKQQAMLVVGCNTLAQASLRSCLLETPESWENATRQKIEDGALAFHASLDKAVTADGRVLLDACKPQGAMYVMVRIHLAHYSDIKDDQDFYAKLYEEENVQVTPGRAFHTEGFFRVVITRPLPVLMEASDRIIEFAKRHASPVA